jgi:hypothetical protein
MKPKIFITVFTKARYFFFFTVRKFYPPPIPQSEEHLLLAIVFALERPTVLE